MKLYGRTDIYIWGRQLEGSSGRLGDILEVFGIGGGIKVFLKASYVFI